MSAQQTIYDRIKKDLEDDKILQNVTLERLWYYFEQIKDITGSGGSGFTNGNGAPSGGADGDYYIQTDGKAIWYNNAGVWGVILSNDDIPISVDDAQDLVMGVGTVVKNAWYNITDGSTALPTGVTSIRIRGLGLTGVNTFDQNFAEAFVTVLGVYVPCTYDVATNKIGGKVILWAGDLTQTGSNDPSVDRTHINLFATNPTFAYVGSGNYLFVAPIDFFSIENFIPTSLILDISGVLVYTNFSAIRKLNIWSGIINDGFYDDILNNTYIEISINLSDLI